MPFLNNPSTASHSAARENTCLAAGNQPQNTEDCSRRQYVKFTATDGAMRCTECTVD